MSGETLDTLAALELADPGDEELDQDEGLEGSGEPGEGDPEKNQLQKDLLEKLAEVISPILMRKPRDPMLAAQRALGAIGSHPELMDAAKILMDFLQANKGKAGKPADYGYPAPEGPGAGKKPFQPAQKGSLVDPQADPHKKKEPGLDTKPFSVAQAQAPAPPEEGEDEMQEQALLQKVELLMQSKLGPMEEQLKKALADNEELQKKLSAQDEKKMKDECAPMAKAMGLPVEQVVALQKSMPPESFEAMRQTLTRTQVLLQKSALFGELGTSLGGDPTSSEVLLEKKARELAGDKADAYALGRAIIKASAESGLGFEPARPLGEVD